MIKEKEEGGDTFHKSIMVELTPKSTMKVVPHTLTNVKNSRLYQGQHDYILNQHRQSLNGKPIAFCSMILRLRLRPSTLSNNKDATNKIAKTLKILEELHGLIALKINVIVTKAFNVTNRWRLPRYALSGTT